MDYKEVIESKYNRTAWEQLLHDIFKSKAEFFSVPATVNINNDGVAKQACYIGKITLADNQQIAVYEVQLSSSVQIDRNKVSIRNLLVSEWRNSGFAGAFMFCYKTNESVLRFSYVSENWSFDEGGKFQKNSTDTKRFTYYLGEGHRSRTAIDEFQKLRDSKQTLSDVARAFSIEAVSNRFFDGYKSIYEDIVAFIIGKKFVKQSNKCKEKIVGTPCEDIYNQFLQFDNPDKSIRDYIKKLMGRLVFLQFLQKKGWMGVPANESWGNGDKEFMQNLFSQSQYQDDFIESVLEPLFNDINNHRANDLVSDAKIGVDIKVPYLNGGLFERDAEDETIVALPKEYFERMFEFFSWFNFTIDENDPNDTEVGVDPEMLGRIFENLLEDNKDKGAFYTPKEIVKYMCQESLIAYLQTDERDGHLEPIRQFVLKHDRALIADYAEEIDKKLKDVKICDPAIGSGAFPMGLLRELFLCRSAIEPDMENNAADIKRHIIQNNIYGVDIEKGAVDIARLRFWLALVVDEKTPETLPNLDFKIMQGNSLLESYKGVDLSKLIYKKTESDHNAGVQLSWYENDLDVIRKELSDKIESYYSCKDHDQRVLIRKDIATIIQKQITSQQYPVTLDNIDIHANDKFFLWHTWFSDVFSRPSKEGFDIVIGNPPYGAKLSVKEKALLKKLYVTTQTKKGIQKGSLDTYTMFIELSYNLLCNGGCFAMIVPISLTSSDSSAGVHRLLLNNCDNIHISSYAVRPKPVFENAVVNTSIMTFRKTEDICRHIYSTKMYRKGHNFNLQTLVDNLEFVEVNNLLLYGRIPKISKQAEVDILNKLFINKRLGDYIKSDGSPIYYRTTGGRYYKVVTNYSTDSTKEKPFYVDSLLQNAIGCILSSNLSFWFYQIYSNNLDWKSYEISEFRLPPLTNDTINQLNTLYVEYLIDIENNANIRQSSGTSSYNVSSFKEYKIGKSKPIIDCIDDLICPLYGLTQEETEFIKNYEIEFRLSNYE